MELGNWYFRSTQLGYPFGQQLYDFPAISDGLGLLFLWCGVRLGASAALVSNLFYLSGYVFASVAGFVGSRMLHVSRLSAVMVGFLFTFLPYHYQHGSAHLFLSWYWTLPIWIALLLRQMTDSPIITDTSWKKSSLLSVAVLGLMAGASGLYYAVFLLISLTFCLLYCKATSRFSNVRPYAVLGIATIISLALQAIPVVLYQFKNGSNPEAANRTVHEVEYYSLRFIDLLLPITQHRIDAFSSFAKENISPFIPGEPYESLGILGLMGVFFLFITLIRKESAGSTVQASIIRPVCYLFVFLVLFTSVGGLGQLLASIGITQIRVWSRISIVLGFLALVVVAVKLDEIKSRFIPKLRVLFIPITLVVMALGFFDTNPPVSKTKYQETALRWNNDLDLVREVEKKFRKNAKIFQLPVMNFPESSSIQQLTDYQPLRGYLHSETLFWSYGATKGREGLWLNDIAAISLEELITRISQVGFDAIWVERRGYSDRAQALIDELESKFGPALVSDRLNEVMVFRIRS
jgi:phosphoglycerol transferase